MVAPALQPFPRPQLPELGLLPRDDLVELAPDHLEDERVLIGEVVVELRLAGCGRGHDVVEAGVGHPPLINERRRPGDDTFAGRRAARGQARVLRTAHAQILSRAGLDSPIYIQHPGPVSPLLPARRGPAPGNGRHAAAAPTAGG